MVTADIRNMQDAEAFIQELVTDYDEKKITRDQFMITLEEYTTHIVKVVTENVINTVNNQLGESNQPKTKIILP